MRKLTLALGLLCASPPLFAQAQVWVVDEAGPITQIHDAVALAASGDTILVKPGAYDAFTVSGKSLVIQGDPSASVYNLVLLPFFPGFEGSAVTITGLAADQSVVLRNLDITNDYQEPPAALAISGCAGPVHVEDSVVTSSTGSAVSVANSSSVVLNRCTLVSEGPFLPNSSPEYEPNPGLRVFGSQVYVFDSDIAGSLGYDKFPLIAEPPSDGGPGARMDGGLLYLSGSTLAGGQGGDYDPLFPPGCIELADGGAGLRMLESGVTPSRVVRFDTDPQGGAGGAQPRSCTLFPDGQPGPDQVLEGGTVSQVPGVPGDAPGFAWESPVRGGSAFTVNYEGPPGHAAFLAFDFGLTPGVLYEPSLLVLNVDLIVTNIVFVGTLPPAGTLDQILVVPEFPPGLETFTATGQALYADPLDPSAPLLFSGPSQLTLVDSAF